MKKLILFFSFILSITVVKAQLNGLTILGNPLDPIDGATWTYNDSIASTIYNLEGILFAPSGTGPFPAVIINHGTNGNAYGLPEAVARIIVQHGFVCIATNYTHSGNVPCGSPGSCVPSVDWGASNANVLRGMKCWDILASLNYVDSACIMTYGSSRGAFVTTAMLASFSAKFRAASHAAGGVSDIVGTSAPPTTMANLISTPYQFHHGDMDTNVPLYFDQQLDSILTQNSVPHQLYIYPGFNHAQMTTDTLQLMRSIEWFELHSCETIGIVEASLVENDILLFPNPASVNLNIFSRNEIVRSASIFDTMGKLLGQFFSSEIDLSDFTCGYYLVVIETDNHIYRRKFIKR